MSLPPGLAEALAALPAPPAVAAAWQRLATAYRAGAPTPPLDAAGAVAYALARMPATAAAIAAALAQVPERPWQSLLDLGAGTGAGAWATRWRCPALQRITALERQAALRELGRRLAPEAQWLAADLAAPPELPAHELVLLAYCLGELAAAERARALAWAWAHAADALLIVEPGIPAGAGVVGAARRQLIALGARIVAPCTHQGPCPLPRPDWGWCHFSIALPRPGRQRRLKGGVRAAERERYAWLLARRTGAPATGARILAPPRRHGGRLELLLCDGQGGRTLTVTREHPDWPRARRCRWGDAWSPS